MENIELLSKKDLRTRGFTDRQIKDLGPPTGIIQTKSKGRPAFGYSLDIVFAAEVQAVVQKPAPLSLTVKSEVVSNTHTLQLDGPVIYVGSLQEPPGFSRPICPLDSNVACFLVKDSRICLLCFQKVKKAGGLDVDGVHELNLSQIKILLDKPTESDKVEDKETDDEPATDSGA